MIIWILVIGQLQLLGDKISNTYRCFHYSPRCFGIANVLLLIMGVAVFKSGVVKDPSFFGLFHALSDPSMMSNGILKNVAKTGILSTLFAVALLASGQNSTIAGTLTGQVVMEGFIHMRMPLWARRLVTRII